MAKFYNELDESLREFIDRQQIFFTATAPIEGRINLSPKGMDTFRCLDHQRVAYLDLTGSGNETSAHLHQTDRITLMFCSFDEQPLILRIYGKGEVLRPHHPQWSTVWQQGNFKDYPGQRQIIVINIESVQTSCGFGVPMFTDHRERPTLEDWAAKKGEVGVQEYQTQKNQISIDGLPTFLEI
jgi:Pyridoxamine 5'-phosphate oxidase